MGRQSLENPSRLAVSGMKKWKVGNTDFGKPWKDGAGNAKRVRTLQESCCENVKKSENPAISCSK